MTRASGADVPRRAARRVLARAVGFAPLPVACLLATTAMSAPAAHAATQVRCDLQDSRLTEASSLVDLDRWLVTANDSGHPPQLFVLDPGTCATVGVTTYAESVTDVESMAPAGAHAVWVGDTGDNARTRSSIRVFRVRVDRGDHTVTAPRFGLVYPDGPHDAEALVAWRGRLYVVTKGLLSGGVYAAPRQLSADRPNRLRRVATAPGMVTDAALLPSGRGVLLRDYSRAYVLSLPGWKVRGSFPLPRERQGEAISVAAGGRVLVTSEGAGAAVLRVRIPDRLLRIVSPRPEAAPEAGPATASPSDVAPTATTPSPARQERKPGPQGNPLPLIALAAVILGAVWGLRRLRRSRVG